MEKSLTGRTVTAVLIGLLTITSACQSAGQRYRPAPPVLLEDWRGLNRIARDGPYFFSSQPDPASLRRLAIEEGVTLVVNLRPVREMENYHFDERQLVEELGMRYAHLPFPRSGLSVETVDRFAEVLAGTSDPVLVHCFASDRVGAIWMAYLVLHLGLDVEEARAAGEAAGMYSEELIRAVLELIDDG